MNLIIVESPTKARTLTRFLDGKGQYRIEATMGHIRDLPKSTLGVDVEHDFKPQYVIPRVRQKRVGELRKIAAKATSVILATDPDREGEAIAFHVSEILANSRQPSAVSKTKKKAESRKLKADSFQRIVFHEITESAIKEALEHPREIDRKLVDAQQARRVLDRLVGYKLSPLLWQKLSRRWLSAGRVQSVAVRLIVEREREIAKFQKEEYWTIEGNFYAEPLAGASLAAHPPSVGNLRVTGAGGPPRRGPLVGVLGGKPPAGPAEDELRVTVLESARPPGSEIRAQLVSKDGVKYEKILSFELFDGKYTTTSSAISNQQSAISIIQDLKSPFTVSAVDKKEVKRYPYPPYTTSTLQQDSGRRLYFSAKKTMQLAQKLYEEGLITYHRTDSVNLSEKFIAEARGFIAKEYGKTYVSDTPRRYKTKSKVAQEAHEAIRPTDVTINYQQLTINNSELNRDHARLYELIWKRAVGSQAAEAIFDSTTIIVASVNGYEFEARGSVVKFDGFLKITGRPASNASPAAKTVRLSGWRSDAGGENNEMIVPDVAVGQTVSLAEAIPTQRFSLPPPRYTEATLVKALEEKDIGRPSTYAPIISTIQERQYVTREDKKLVPTDLGNSVTDFLVQYFATIIDLPFTAKMEGSLDQIANGQRDWVPVIREFYAPFAEILERTYIEAERVKLPVEETGEKCPECGNPLVVRTGRYGKFIACSTFPKCKFTKQLVEKIDMKCPRCGGDIVIKKSRRGKTFYGCSNYPKCTFAAWKKEDIK